MKVPLRVDFAGGWLDVPAHAVKGTYIVNCAIEPLVSLESWGYEKNSGLGGSAAWSILNGNANPVDVELQTAGWQDPAVIQETGLCVWRSGPRPVLHAKFNPDYLTGCLALAWTGRPHVTADILPMPRNYDAIARAGAMAALAAQTRLITMLGKAVALSYACQLAEGMAPLPIEGALAAKYCGSGHGGYAVYLFEHPSSRERFLGTMHSMPIMAVEPYLRTS